MAAIEFAMVLPVLLLIIVGSFDAAMATIFQSEVTYAADEIGLAATALAYNTTNTQNDVTPTIADQAMSIVYASVPALREGLASLSAYSVTMTSISFASTGKPVGCNDAAGACTVAANIAWVAELDLGAAPTLPVPSGSMTALCELPFNPLTPSTPQASQISWTQFSSQVPHNIPTIVSQTLVNGNLTSVNMSGLQGSTLLATDVTLTYRPFFLKFFTGPVVLSSTSYQVPRGGTNAPLTYDSTTLGGYATAVTADTLDLVHTSPPAVICNGYK